MSNYVLGLYLTPCAAMFSLCDMISVRCECLYSLATFLRHPTNWKRSPNSASSCFLKLSIKKAVSSSSVKKSRTHTAASNLESHCGKSVPNCLPWSVTYVCQLCLPNEMGSDHNVGRKWSDVIIQINCPDWDCRLILVGDRVLQDKSGDAFVSSQQVSNVWLNPTHTILLLEYLNRAPDVD